MMNNPYQLCPNCSTQNPNDRRFCRNCAFDLTEVAFFQEADHSAAIPKQVVPIPNQQTIDFQATSKISPAPILTRELKIALGSVSAFIFVVALIAGISSTLSLTRAGRASTTSEAARNADFGDTSQPDPKSYTSTYQPANVTSNRSANFTGRAGRLSTNLNLRTAPNKNALSVGIHFQNARFRVLAEESYETEDGYSTWYKVKIFEYGCDAQGNLGCGKNNSNDSDEGWLNARYVYLE